MEQNNGWALAGCQGVQLEPLHRHAVRNDQLGGFSPWAITGTADATSRFKAKQREEAVPMALQCVPPVEKARTPHGAGRLMVAILLS